MKPIIKTCGERKLVGMRLPMSLMNNRTAELWKSFIPEKKKITNNVTNDLISLQVYKPGYFENFSPSAEFEKWATIEVSDFNNAPGNLEKLVLNDGLYAVFEYKGSSDDPSVFQYIFQTWLPASEYRLDQRPHFEVLGEKYRNQHPDSEEEIWIPVTLKDES